MNFPATPGLGVPPRTLVAVFAAMAILFAGVTFLSRAYGHRRLARAQQYFERGGELAAQGKGEQAVREYRNALSIAPSSGIYRLALARILMRLDHLEEASIYLQELLQEDPGNAVPTLLLARIAARENRSEAAVNYYHRAIFGYWPEKPEENRLEARWELIGLLEKSGSRKQILAELLEVADQAPNDPALKKRVAWRLLQNGSPNQAEELFREVLRQRPRDADALAGYGEAQFAQAQYRRAQIYLRRAVQAQADNREAKRELEQVNQILELDPRLRGLSVKERYERSRALLERTLAALQDCLGRSKTPPPEAMQVAENARKQLAARRRRLGEATEANLSRVEDLWTARGKVCGPPNGSDPVLARVMASLLE